MNNDNNTLKNVTPLAGWLLLGSAIAFYVYGIYTAIDSTLHDKTMQEFLANSITAIQALLLTNLGFLLGISVSKPSSGLASAMRLGAEGTQEAMTTKDIVQVVASLLYVVSLIACTLVLIIHGKGVPVVEDSAKMLISVAIAYVTVYLSR